MRVLDNLENYDIPSGFHLTEEQEEQLAADLKEIVLALIPLRSSKLKTRQYFNSHLRYTSNVKEAQKLPSAPQDRYEFGDSYTPLPGEYTWNSDLLQPALLDILRPDQWSFGYVVNYIEADIAHRHNERYYKNNATSDALVQFALAFDIEEIRAQAKAIDDPRKRVLFLNTKLTDYRIFEGLNRDEEAWVDEIVGSALRALLEEAEKELKLSDGQQKQPSKDVQQASQAKSKPQKEHIHPVAQRPVLYDLGIAALPQFASMRMEFHGGVLTTPWANERAFESVIRAMFSNCYDAENNFQKDEVIFEEYPRYVLGLLDSYSRHQQDVYRNNNHAGLKLVFEWMHKTIAIIEDIYQTIPAIYEKGKHHYAGDPANRPSVGTWPMKLLVLETLYSAFPNMYGYLVPRVTKSLATIVPYNMWNDELPTLEAKYTNQFGLEFTKRAVVKPVENRRRFAQVLAEQCATFCVQMSNNPGGREEEDVFKGCYNPMTSLLHGYFADYVKRVQAKSDDATEIDQALMAWLLALQEDIQICYASRYNSIRRQCGATSRTDYSMMRFYYDICEKNVFDMAVEFFQDCETISLVPPKPVDINENPEPAPQPEPVPADVKPEAKEGKPIHHKTIDYQTLYDEWVDVAFTNTSLEEFTNAIDQADFSTMLSRAKDAGARAGYIGGIKYIMKSLKSYLGTNWYDIACGNIGEDQDSVNKLNDGTKQIKKINVKILSDCIK